MNTNFQSGPVNLNDDGKPLRFEDAAERRTVEGWSCIKCGRFYGDGEGCERAARYCCHTDARCPECENRKDRGNVLCESCWHKKRVATWESLEQVDAADAPSNANPLCIMDGDTYFFDEDSLIEWCADNGTKPSESFLVMCKPHNPPEFSMRDFVDDYMPGDGYCHLPGDEGATAEEAVNAYLRAHDPWSWYPDNKRRPSNAVLSRLDKTDDAESAFENQ